MYLKIGDLKRLCQSALNSNHYLALRESDGYSSGFNPRMLHIKSLRMGQDCNRSAFVSYRFISFQEYIQIKRPFLN